MLMRALVWIIATAAVLFFIQRYVPGIHVDNWTVAFVVAIIWGILGFTVRPVLTVLTLPINILTFGLFSFIVNALLFWLVAAIIPGFRIDSFLPALYGSAILAVVSWLLHKALRHE
jgi:putative membrane protein